MPLNWLIPIIVDNVFGYILNQSGSAARLQDMLGSSTQRAFKRAMHKAFERFEMQHPQWASSLFDASFFQHEGAPILAQFLLPDGHPDPSELATCWAKAINIHHPELRTTRIRDLEPAAADFLDYLNHALKAEPQLIKLHKSRTFEQIASGIDTISNTIQTFRHKLEDDKATTGTRQDYLHWLIERNLYLDPRGTLQVQRQVQVKLDEIYISLRAQREETSNSVDRRLLEQEIAELEANLIPSALRAEEIEDQHEQLLAHFESRLMNTSSDRLDKVLELAEVVNRYERLVILGDPGSGKSTLLRYLALKHAQAMKNGSAEARANLGTTRFPILLRIADYAEHGLPRGKSLSDFLADYCGMYECPQAGLADLLATELSAGNCLILLDGLDEIVSADERRNVVQHIEDFVRRHSSHSNHFVITSRITGYRIASLGSPFHHFYIQDMDELQIRRFLERWCSAVETAQTPELSLEIREVIAKRETDAILKAVQTSPGVRRLATNPLLLRILALIHRTGAQLPQKRIELYRLAADTLAHTWRPAQGVPASALVTDEYLTPLLSELAYWLHVNKPTGVATEREVYKVLGNAWANLHELPWDADNPNPRIELEVKKFLLAVREHTGLFVERAPKRYGFMHLTFEEYYAARYLVARSKTRAKLIHQHLHDPRWEEPILLSFGFVSLESSIESQELLETTIFAEGDEAKALGFTPSLYEDLLGRDYLFALRCLGDSISVRPMLLQELVKRLANELLHKKGPARFPRYRQALDERIGQLKGSKGGAALLPLLATALSDPDPDVRARSANCLEGLGQASPEVISALLEKLRRDAKAGVRSLGAASLGRLGLADPEVITALVHALDDSSFSVRKEAASSLGALGQTSSGVITALLHALHNPEFVRKSVETSLEQLDHVSPEVVTTLIDASQDTAAGVRESVVRILGRLSKASPEVVTTLINASQDIAAGVRKAAIDSLGQQGQVSPDVMITLTNALHDADTTICKAAIGSLGQLSKIDPGIVIILINALRDSDSLVRQYIARNLGLLGIVSPEILSMLIDALDDVDALVRREAARSLGQLNQVTPDVISALLLILCDSNILVRSVAVESLGKLGQATPKVIDALLSALHESNLLMRCEAARSLGQLGQTSHEVITALLGALCDVHFCVRLEAMKSLGRLGQTSPEVVTALLNFLNNADSNISTWAAHSLGLIGQPSSEVVIALLKELDQSNDWSLRHNAAISLGKVSRGDEPTIQALWYGLLDKDKDVRTACAEGLAQLGQRFPEVAEGIAKRLVQAIADPEFDKLDNSKIRACNYAFDALWLLMNAKTQNRVHKGLGTETQQVFVPELSVDEQGIVGLG